MRKVNGGKVMVTGPGCEGREAATPMVGVSVATTLAARASHDGTWYVRDGEGTVTHRVERQGRTTFVRKNGGAS